MADDNNLTICFDDFATNPQLLFEEIRKRGVDGVIRYHGMLFIVSLDSSKAANDSSYTP